jgi:hypothetical protein
MQKQDAIDLADRIMREAPGVSVNVEHEGAYAPDSYAVQLVDGLIPRTVTITSQEEWERYRAGQQVRQDQWEGLENEMDRDFRPADGEQRPMQ